MFASCPQPKTCVGAAERQGVQRHCMAQSILRGRSYGFHVEVSEANRVGMGSQVRHPTARPTRNLWWLPKEIPTFLCAYLMLHDEYF